MQRVCVNAEGTQNSQGRPLGLGRVDDRPRRAEEIGFSKSHEGRFVWHDRTRVRRAASGAEPTAGVGGSPPPTRVARIPKSVLGCARSVPDGSKSGWRKLYDRMTGFRARGGG